MKDRLYRQLAKLLSFDDLRRVLNAVLPRTTVREVVARTPEGRFLLDTHDRIISWSIIGKGVWEPVESQILSDLVLPGDTVLDIGANIGWYTILFANRVKEGGRVIAFEPDPHNFELLKTNVALNEKRNVVLNQFALVDESGSFSLVRDAENFGDHHVAFAPAPARGDVKSVAGYRLDDVLVDDGPIRLIKIDCQGSEPAILRGAERTLSRCEYVAIEYWPDGLRRAGFQTQELLALLTSRFKRFCRLHEYPAAEFRPIEELEHDAGRIVGTHGINDSTDYLFAD